MNKIMEVDSKLRRCAECLVSFYHAEKVDMKKATSSCFGYYDEIDAFMTHFNYFFRIRFPKMDEEEVSTRAEHTLSNFIDIISCLVEGRNLPGIHVMLPVMLYVLTMNNFFNKSSIQKRVTRNEKYQRKHGKNRGDEKAKKWEGPDDDPRYVIHHRELCAIERKIACEDTAASYRASGATETLFPDVENLYYDFSNDEDLSLKAYGFVEDFCDIFTNTDDQIGF